MDEIVHPRPTPTFLFTTLLLVASLLAAPALGQETGVNAAAPTGDAAPSGEVGAALGFGQVDEDFFLTVGISAGLGLDVPKIACHGFFPESGASLSDDPCLTPLRFGVLVPLRLRVIDQDPQTEDVLRKEDWDEVGDYLRVLRFVEYGRRREPVYARVGELAGVVIGHGTAMNGYFNTIDVDHHQFGLNSNLNSRFGGVELVLDNFVEPEVFGYRVYAYPAQLLAPESFWTRLGVGTSLILDIDAPLRFRRVDATVDPNIPLAVDEERNLIPESTDTTGVFGLDTELVLVQEELIDFIPYLDLNFHLDGSPGIHLGTFTNVRPLDELHLNTRVELRWLGNNYIPDYFSTLYEIERDSYFGFGGLGQPKLVVLEELDQGQVAGVYGEATFQVYRFLQVTGAYEDYQGPRNASVLARARITDLGPLRLGALYRRSGFNGISDAFSLDHALLLGEARWQVNSLLYVGGTYSRLYRLQEDGAFDTVDDWSVGVGVSVAF